ncbi:lysophospholipid acyltransferase LPEAT2 [Aristolochia californica]|uniref:lysophospholipid acyltransferase LPEAT2 n=1 Tax=Aristolochia californica TaxID=171875 RepID=UPI0035D61BF7
MTGARPVDLTAPLLHGSRLLVSSEAELIVDIDGPGNGALGPVVESHNPYGFLGAGFISLPPPSPVDPFRNNTPEIGGLYEWLKIVVCIPIALLRLVIFGLSLLVGYLATKLALEGWKDKHNPLPKWRCRIMWITRLCSRCILFSFGYHWIKRVGRPASRENAPIVVSNHVSYVEPIFFFYELFPTIVASESHDAIPFVGTIIRAMQVIYVNRFSASSRKHAVSEIKRKASSDGFPRVLLFPEGTTTNGRVLISFQLGAFIPGYAIQPVVVRYPHVFFDQSWGNTSLIKLMFRMFTQFHNFMEVEYLPVVFPLENKKESASQFAERVSYTIASALNVPQTCHSYGDLLLLTKALETGQGQASVYMVEMAWVESTFNLSTLEALEFLDKFLAMNPDSSGRVNKDGFFSVLRLESSLLAEKIFEFLDVEKRGSITFRQFLLGSAQVMKQPLFQRACAAAFDVCDEESKEQISKKQLRDAIWSTGSGTSEKNVADLFNLFDVDNDGIISWEDFTSCLTKNPLLIAVFSHFLTSCLLEGDWRCYESHRQRNLTL